MTQQNKNKLVPQDVYDAFNGKDLNYFGSLLADDYFFEKHDGGRIDSDAFLGFIKSSWESFPDGTITGVDNVGTGDHIVGEGRFDGTHLGDYMGVPATGKRVSWYFAEFFQFEGNKVKSMKVYSDSVAVVRQIGVVPIGYLAQ